VSALVAENLHVRLGGKQVLAGVSASFETGAVTAILGPNGAGKSTFLSCLAGLRKPAQGHVRLGAADLLRMEPRARARRLGFIPQTPEVAWAVETRILVGLGRTPFIGARGLSAEDAAIIDRAMAEAEVTELADRDVTTLSGGERGREIGRASCRGEG